MVCGDSNYCTEHKECYTDKQICRPNKCKDFDLNPIDALGVNLKGYKPRETKPKDNDFEQLRLE
jgi:hypothetical protein